MSKILGIAVVLILIGLATGAGAVYSGAYNVGASTPHWRIT